MTRSKEMKFFDFSPFLRRDFNTASRGGALADAFSAVSDTVDGYGENKDEKLLSQYANETDKSKIENADFYNPLNQLTAGKVVDKNIDRNYNLEQRAKEEAQYAIDQFTNAALNDVMTMTKEDWDKKYANAGGLDMLKVNDAWNKKTDRKYLLDQRKQKKIDDANRRARENQKWIDYQNAKKQENYDKKALYAYQTGEVKDIETFKKLYPNASKNALLTVSKEIENRNITNRLNTLTSKYKSFNEFKASDDWATTSYDTKVALSQNKFWGDETQKPVLTYQEKLNQEYEKNIDNLSSSLETNDLSNFDYDKAIKDGKITENDRLKYTRRLSQATSSKEVDKIIKSGDFATIAGKAKTFEKFYKNNTKDTGVIQNMVDSATQYLPDMSITKDDLENQEFRSAFLGFSSIFLKIQSGLTVTDKERATFNQSLGTLKKSKQINLVGIVDKLKEAEQRVNSVKSVAPAYFNIKYGKDYKPLSDTINNLESIAFGDKETISKPKVIGVDIHQNKQTTTKTLSADDILKGNF